MRRRGTNRPAVSFLIAGLLLVVSVRAFAEPSAPSEQTIAQSRGSGKIAGRVRVEGRFKRPEPLKVFKNRKFCGTKVPDQSLLVGARGGVQNVVITVHADRGKETGKLSNTAATAVLDNKNCVFVAHVQVVPVGSEVMLLNSDLILHRQRRGSRSAI